MLTGLDTFNIVASILGIASVFFSVWIYVEARKKEAVEQERAVSLGRRLDDAVQLLTAIGAQGALIANLADRDETTKKELKHLAVALLSTTESLRTTLQNEERARSEWTFGVPSRYVDLKKVIASKPAEAAEKTN